MPRGFSKDQNHPVVLVRGSQQLFTQVKWIHVASSVARTPRERSFL